MMHTLPRPALSAKHCCSQGHEKEPLSGVCWPQDASGEHRCGPPRPQPPQPQPPRPQPPREPSGWPWILLCKLLTGRQPTWQLKGARSGLGKSGTLTQGPKCPAGATWHTVELPARTPASHASVPGFHSQLRSQLMLPALMHARRWQVMAAKA